MSHDWREVDGFTFVATISSGEDGRNGPIETALWSCDDCGTVVANGFLATHHSTHEGDSE